MKIRGEFFEALSSQSHECFLIHENDEITIETREGSIVRDLRIDSVQGADNVYFVCGRYFKSDQPLPREFCAEFQSKTRKIISWLEEFSLGRAAILSLILLGFVFFYRVALSSAGETIALIFPDHWERKIGENSYRGLRRIALSESALTARKQDYLRERAKEMARRAELARRPQILFHDTDLLGANAFAFPGGPIVITDDIVNLLDEDELLAVIAHEYSHIEDRHSLRQIIELIGVSVLAHILFGVDDSLIEEMTAVAIDVWGFRNSRDFEKRADLEAIGILKANDIDPASLVRAIGKLRQYGCEETDDGPSRKCLSKAKTGWLSTHPGDDERFEYLSEQIDQP